MTLFMNYNDSVMNLTVYGIQSRSHCLSKAFCVLLVGKIQTINLTLVSPLMKCGRGLVIFQTTNDCTVNDHLQNISMNWVIIKIRK